MAEITSTLYKTLQLTRASSYFPMLVQGAAAIEGVPYTDELLVYVASRPEVTTAIPVTITDGVPSAVDPVIEDLLVTAGADVDAVILAAVRSYIPPTTP